VLLIALLAAATALASGLSRAEHEVRTVQRQVEQGRAATARAELERQLARSPGDRRAALAQATLDRLTYRYEAAESAYRHLSGADDVAAHAQLGLALLYLQEFRLPAADSAFRRATDAFVRQGDRSGEAQALSYLGVTLSRSATLDSAAVVHALAQRRAPDDPWLLPLVRCNALAVEVRLARPEAGREARALAQRALAVDNPRAASGCLAAAAQDFERRTLTDSAFAVFAEVAEIQRRSGNFSGLAATRQWQGFVYQTRGRYQEARDALGEAITLGERTRARAASAWASLNLAGIALTFGDLTSAGQHARAALRRFEEIGDRWGRMNARAYEGDMALLGGNAAAARAAYDEVTRLAPGVLPSMEVHALGRLAFVSLREGDVVGAQREIDAARALARRLDMPAWMEEEDVYARAVIALQRQDYDRATLLLRQLLRTLSADQRGPRADVLTRLAEASLGRGDIAQVERELRLAATVVDSARDGMSSREFRRALLNARNLDWDRDLGFATVIEGLARAGRARAAFSLAEQRRARSLLEQLARRRSLTDAPERAESERIASDSVVRARLPDSTAVLSFVTGASGEPTTVFVLTRAALRTVRAAPIDAHVVELERFSGLVASGDVPRELARRIGAAFLHDALALVPGDVHHLVIIPDGPLHRLPFDLVTDATGALLIDRYAISFAPSASMLAAAWATAPRAPRGRIVAFGDPAGVRLGGEADSIASPLPAAAKEAVRVARFAPSSSAFIGVEARESTLRELDMRQVSVLHFATHADVDNWSMLRSALLLAPGGGHDGALRGDELSALDLPVAVVVLSACNSGSGAVLSGEGLQGLVSPFLEAGAASVLASLWPIADVPAAAMTERLYLALAAGHPAGEALWRAKRAARQAGLSPAVWAAFTVTGDARVATPLREPRPLLPSVAQWGSVALLLALGGYGAARTMRRRNGDAR
jgi:tetratricopeptide (TPR) repeat protein